MRPGEGPTGCRVVERRPGPAAGVVALVAGGWEGDRQMAWVCRLLVIRHVAAGAGCLRAGVLTADVAARARDGGVRPGQRKNGLAVIKRGRLPRRGVVADGALLREPAGHVVRIRGVVEIVQVAGNAAGIGGGQSPAAVA